VPARGADAAERAALAPRNVAALADALLWSLTWPVGACLATYCYLYWSGHYARDRERAQRGAAAADKEDADDAPPLQAEPSAARRQVGAALALAPFAVYAVRAFSSEWAPQPG